MYGDILPFDGSDGLWLYVITPPNQLRTARTRRPSASWSRRWTLTMEEDELVDLILTDMPPRPANYEDIIATNLGQSTVDDEEAFTLEVGPSNCTASQSSLAGD